MKPTSRSSKPKKKRRVSGPYAGPVEGLMGAIRRDQQRRSLERECRMLAPSFSPPWPEPHFIRYGEPPPDGVSYDHWRGSLEPGGVSVWPARFDFDRESWIPDIGGADDALCGFLQGIFKRPCFLVRGDIVGRGSAGEPLMHPIEKKVRIINPSMVQWQGRVLNGKEADAAVLEQVKAEDRVFEEMLEAVLPHSTEVARKSVLHGPTPHWRTVAKWGRILTKAMQEGSVGNLENVAYPLESDTFEPQEIDLGVVRWFACLHDSQRLSDGYDPRHGARAAEKSLALREAGVITLSDEQFDQLYEALYYHAGGYVSRDDVTVGCCFDADRMTLGRVGIKPKVKFMSTPAARGLILRHQAAANR